MAYIERTRPSKQHRLVSSVVFWHDAGSEGQLSAAARTVWAEPLACLAMTELAASAPTPSTIGVSIVKQGLGEGLLLGRDGV